ncbi:MAG TPA: hypothetical protein VEU51_16260 [Candidatus Acidoferrales bacterium]|nr:hypothetical protein [Candidatus Acidoferrales bacterium]
MAKKKAAVQIGFVGVVPSPQKFQNVLLNVQAVRINPSSTAGPGDKKWQIIPVPPGVSGGQGHPGDLQVDLAAAQNVPVLFNTTFVRPDSYEIAELLLDPTNPGTLVPVCPSAPGGEGCINYPIVLQNTGNPITVVAPTGQFLVSAAKESVSQLVLQLQVSLVPPFPTVSGGAYTANVTLAQLTNPLFISVTGMVTATGGTISNKKKVRKLAVAAEVAGTNTIISTATINSKSMYNLLLPAAGSFGSLYDLTVTGGSVSYAATRLPALLQSTGSLAQDFTVAGGQSTGNITGKISDACTGRGISGATLQLFIPPASNPTADCTNLATIGECVSVASTTTDNTGAFPVPGTTQNPALFNSVPILKSSAIPNTYSMMVTAPGYDPLITQVNPSTKANGGVCGVTPNTGACDLSLNTGLINAMFPIVPPSPGQTVLVQVFAEDAGTNKIESALAMPFVVKNSSNVVNVMINVPPSVPMFDLFATSIDLFQGVSDPYQGHTIEVIRNVPSPGEPMNGCQTVVAHSTGTMSCVGHGSINGTVINADLGTSVTLSKGGVQVTNTPVQNLIQNPNQPTTSSYNFCVPADTYDVQRFQVAAQSTSLAPTATPTPVPAGPPQSVTIPPPPIIPTPNATPTPFVKCPTSCLFPDGTCPGNCNATTPAVNPL